MSDSFTRKIRKCRWFFDELALKLGDDYTIVNSDRNENSSILTKVGTEDQITWYGKPDKSVRISNCWNWYASAFRCEDREHIQCYTKDLPKPRERRKENGTSRPWMACSVAVYINGEYHIVYGEAFDPKTKKWYWRNQMSPDQVADMIIGDEKC